MYEHDPFPAVTLDGSEKRITNRIKKCWSAATPIDGFPTLEGMYGQFLGDFWDRTFVAEPSATGSAYTFKEVGDVFASEFRRPLANLNIASAVSGTLLHFCVRDLPVIQVKQAPAFFSGEYVSFQGQVMLYRCALFPLVASCGGLAILGAGWHRAAN